MSPRHLLREMHRTFYQAIFKTICETLFSSLSLMPATSPQKLWNVSEDLFAQQEKTHSPQNMWISYRPWRRQTADDCSCDSNSGSGAEFDIAFAFSIFRLLKRDDSKDLSSPATNVLGACCILFGRVHTAA